MRTRRFKRFLLGIGVVAVLTIGSVGAWLFQELEYSRIQSPDRKYQAIITCRRLEYFRPTFPGQSGDKAGFVRIVGVNGTDYGRIPIPMVWLARDLEWVDGGAELRLICRWNFASREYSYWNDSQTIEIVKRLR